MNNKKNSKQTSLYDVVKKLTQKKFDMPSVKLVSDGDVITFLKKTLV